MCAVSGLVAADSGLDITPSMSSIVCSLQLFVLDLLVSEPMLLCLVPTSVSSSESSSSSAIFSSLSSLTIGLAAGCSRTGPFSTSGSEGAIVDIVSSVRLHRGGWRSFVACGKKNVMSGLRASNDAHIMPTLASTIDHVTASADDAV